MANHIDITGAARKCRATNLKADGHGDEQHRGCGMSDDADPGRLRMLHMCNIEALQREVEDFRDQAAAIFEKSEQSEAEIARLRRKIICESGVLQKTTWSVRSIPGLNSIVLETDATDYLALERYFCIGDRERIHGIFLDDDGTADLSLTTNQRALLLTISYQGDPTIAFAWIERLKLPVDLDKLDDAIRGTDELAAFMKEIRGRLYQASEVGKTRRTVNSSSE